MELRCNCLNLSYTFPTLTKRILFEIGFVSLHVNVNYLHRIQVILQSNSVTKLATHVSPPATIL